MENNYTNIGVRVLDGFTATHAGVGSEPASPVTVDGVEFPLTAWKDGLLVKVKSDRNQYRWGLSSRCQISPVA